MKSLIHQAQHDCTDARVNLVDQLADRVRSMAARYGRSRPEEYEDLLQEAWVGLLSALPEVDVGIGQPEEFLLKRARWRALDYMKWQQRRVCDVLDDDLEIQAVANPEQTAVGAAFMSVLLTKLSTTQQCLLLLLLDGFTWREAAHCLGCASSNIAYHVKAIRRAYGDLVGDAERENK